MILIIHSCINMPEGKCFQLGKYYCVYFRIRNIYLLPFKAALATFCNSPSNSHTNINAFIKYYLHIVYNYVEIRWPIFTFDALFTVNNDNDSKAQTKKANIGKQSKVKWLHTKDGTNNANKKYDRGKMKFANIPEIYETYRASILKK